MGSSLSVQASLLITGLGAGYVAALRAPDGSAAAIGGGMLAGLIGGAFLAGLIVLSGVFALRSFLPNASPDLLDLLTFESEPAVSGFWMPDRWAAWYWACWARRWPCCRPLLRGLVLVNLAAVVIMGLFAGLLRTPMLAGPLATWLARCSRPRV